MATPPFVLQLRERLGSDLLWLVGVSAVTVDDAGRVLLGQRSDSGRWAVISGILEPGEQPALGLAREVEEETNVVVRAERLSSAITGSVITYPNGDQAQYLDLTFRCRPVSGEARVNDDESLDVGWFPLDELPGGLSEQDQRRIADAIGKSPQAVFRTEP